MKVRIVASSSSANWYAPFIGQELDVQAPHYDSNRGGFYVVCNTANPVKTVLCCDVVEVTK